MTRRISRGVAKRDPDFRRIGSGSENLWEVWGLRLTVRLLRRLWFPVLRLFLRGSGGHLTLGTGTYRLYRARGSGFTTGAGGAEPRVSITVRHAGGAHLFQRLFPPQRSKAPGQRARVGRE